MDCSMGQFGVAVSKGIEHVSLRALRSATRDGQPAHYHGLLQRLQHCQLEGESTRVPALKPLVVTFYGERTINAGFRMTDCTARSLVPDGCSKDTL